MHIATPCHEAWDDMAPRHAGRHCTVCDKTVVDLAALPVAARRERVAALTREARQGARLCVRGVVERDGALAGSRRVLTGGMAVLLAMTLAGCMGDGPQVEHAKAAAAPAAEAPTAMPADLRAVAPPVLLTAVEPVQPDAAAVTPPRTTDQRAMGEMAVPEPVEPVMVQPEPEYRPRVAMGAIACPPPTPQAPHAAN